MPSPRQNDEHTIALASLSADRRGQMDQDAWGIACSLPLQAIDTGYSFWNEMSEDDKQRIRKMHCIGISHALEHSPPINHDCDIVKKFVGLLAHQSSSFGDIYKVENHAFA